MKIVHSFPLRSSLYSIYLISLVVITSSSENLGEAVECSPPPLLRKRPIDIKENMFDANTSGGRLPLRYISMNESSQRISHVKGVR